MVLARRLGYFPTLFIMSLFGRSTEQGTPVLADCQLQLYFIVSFDFIFHLLGLKSPLACKFLSFKAAIYICIVFMFNGCSSSSYTFQPIDTKIGILLQFNVLLFVYQPKSSLQNYQLPNHKILIVNNIVNPLLTEKSTLDKM